MRPAVLLIVFISSFLLYLTVLMQFMKMQSSGRMIRKRMNDFEKDLETATEKKEEELSLVRDLSLSEIPLLDRILAHLNVTRKLSRLIEQAGMNLKVGQLTLMMVVCGALGLVFTARTPNFLLKALVCTALFFTPLFVVNTKRKSRLQAFIRAFPDAIDMINGALRAGHAFPRALQLVADEAPDPVGIEFRRTVEEYNLGTQWSLAFRHLLERVDSADLRLFVTAVMLQRETGGNLNEILESIGLTIRERFKLMGQMRAFTAQGRMSGWVLGSLPIAFILLMSMINPNYLTPLLHKKLGQYMLISAGMLQLMGFYVINKIVQVKYQ